MLSTRLEHEIPRLLDEHLLGRLGGVCEDDEDPGVVVGGVTVTKPRRPILGVLEDTVWAGQIVEVVVPDLRERGVEQVAVFQAGTIPLPTRGETHT